MPKMKTRKAAAKRFKITATGKILRRQAGASHYFMKKSKARKRRLRQEVEATKAQRKAIISWCPYILKKGL